jgi:hypothetical protein
MPSADDSIQRALNEAKKQELREKYGAEFHPGDRNIPPDVEGRWLRDIEEFERQFEYAEQIPVRRFIGNPPVRPLGEIRPEDLGDELRRLLDILQSNNIQVTFPDELSDAEAYRFLAEELLLQEIADIRVDGFTLNFLYSEFHPDTLQDATWAAEDFFQALFERRHQVIMDLLTTKAPADRSGEFPDALRQKIHGFLNDVAVFLDWDAEVTHCSLDDGHASVLARVFWTGLDAATLRKSSASGRASIRLKRLEASWQVIQADIPGLPPD